MALGAAFGALGSSGGAGGLSTGSGAESGPAISGRSTITVAPNTPNIGAIMAAVQGSSTEGGIPVTGRAGLPSLENSTGFNISLPGAKAGIAVSPILLIGGGLLAFVLFRRFA